MISERSQQHTGLQTERQFAQNAFRIEEFLDLENVTFILDPIPLDTHHDQGSFQIEGKEDARLALIVHLPGNVKKLRRDTRVFSRLGAQPDSRPLSSAALDLLD